MTEDIQRKLQHEVDSFKAAQKELQKIVTTRQQLDSQLNENTIVKDELNLLKAEALVYKSVGPILIKTDLAEAKENVTKRIQFITAELARVDNEILSIEKKQDAHRENLQKLQHNFQQAQVKAAMKA